VSGIRRGEIRKKTATNDRKWIEKACLRGEIMNKRDFKAEKRVIFHISALYNSPQQLAFSFVV